MRRCISAVGVVALGSFVGCTPSLEARMDEANTAGCGRIFADEPSVRRDPGYSARPEGARIVYESRLAMCYLDERKPEKAMEIAAAWKDVEARYQRPPIYARAYAALGKETEAQTALAEAVREGTTVEFLTETEEFKQFAAASWYVDYVLTVWAKEQEPALDTLVERLATRAGTKLLSLRIAAADRTRDPGEWVLWTGISKEQRIEREATKTRVVAEGVDVKRQLQYIGRTVTGYTATRADHVRVESEETRGYKDAFVPNGHDFVIVYPQVSERLAQMKIVTALGKYAGRDSENDLPVVSAFLVLEPKPNEHEEHGP